MNHLKEYMPPERFEQLNNGGFDMDQFFKESYHAPDTVICATEERLVTTEEKVSN